MLSHHLTINLLLALWLAFLPSTSIADKHSAQTVVDSKVLLQHYYADIDSKQHISIAVQSFLGKNSAIEKWQPLIELLNQEFKKYHFELFVIEAQNTALLQELVAEDKLDYVITQPVTTAELEFLSGITPIMTKLDKHGVSQFGSVIFTASSNSNINSIQDLKGVSFAGANPVGLGGWILGYDYLLSQGVDPYTDLSRIDFLGRQDNIVDAVKKGMVDAGVIRTGVLEKMIKDGRIQLSDIKVLDAKSYFPYILSTHLMPEWALSSTNKASLDLTKSIVSLLSQINVVQKQNHSLVNWTKVADYQIIHKLLKKHKLSIYRDAWWISFVKRYYQYLVFLFLIVIASIWFLRNRRLKKVNHYKVELERLSRIRSVDQLLSEIAHEIAQPVTSIKIDVKVIEKLLRDVDTVSDESIIKVVESLGQKTDHCVDVINSIRSFLSAKEITHKMVNVNNHITNVIKLVNNEINDNNIVVKLYLESELPLVLLSAVEFDQVLLNLCRNAISAMGKLQHKTRRLTISTALIGSNITISVVDTGTGVKDEENLFKLFKTDKLLNNFEGLGLGLSLSRSIIRSYDGDLTLAASSVQGSTFLITLPNKNE